jgi:hypothetical protein
LSIGGSRHFPGPVDLPVPDPFNLLSGSEYTPPPRNTPRR